MTRQQIVSNLKGIFTPVVTPFGRRGEVDEAKFCENLRRLAGIGLSGMIVAGSTGEAPYLAERERLRLVEVARRIVRPPELLIAGTGLESTQETIRLSREAIARGADALLVVTPNYYKSRMDERALTTHYHAVADAVRRPVIVYSIPQFTGIRMEASTIGRISRHPNVVALKDSSGDVPSLRKVLGKVRPGFRVLVGAVAIFFDALREGAVGAVLGQSNFVPELCLGLYEAFMHGKFKTAREFQQRLIPLAQKVAVPFGIPGVKAALDLCGFPGGPPRLPLQPLNAAQRRLVAAALHEARQGLDY